MLATELQKRIDILHGKQYKLVGKEKAVNLSGKATLKCLVCKNTWTPRLVNVLYNRSGCPNCKKVSPFRKTNATYDSELSEKFPWIQRIGDYRRSLYDLEHFCLKCGTSFLQKPNRVLTARKNPCLTCSYVERNADRKITVKEFYKRQRKLHGKLLFSVVGDFVGIGGKSNFQCNECQHVWRTNASVLLRKASFGCPSCHERRKPYLNFTKKEYQLGRRLVLVQGYEPQALDWIFANTSVKPKEVIVSDVPPIQYTFEKKGRYHFPDIYVPTRNLYVEVKGTRTFGLWDTTLLRQNQAKSRQAKQQGFKYILLLMTGKGDRLKLPKNWDSLSTDKVVTYVRQQINKGS